MSWTAFSRRFRKDVRGEAGERTSPMTFREFVARANPRYRWNWHHAELAVVIQTLADEGFLLHPLTGKRIHRVLVTLPPRHGKSELISRLATAYMVYRRRGAWAALASYGAELAYGLSRSARASFVLLGGTLQPDDRSIKKWASEMGGGLWAAGVGGAATGKGFSSLGVIDDPTKNFQEAQSPAKKLALRDWYQAVWSTRREDDAPEFLVLTRWAEDDLAGWLMAAEKEECGDPDGEPEGWWIIDRPAICEAAEDRPSFPASCWVMPDPRTVGEALWPDKYPVKKLERLRRRIGEHFWQALYQQRPTAREGGMFKVSRIEVVGTMPKGLRAARAWDTGASAELTADATAGVRMHGPDRDGNVYIDHVAHMRHDTDERNRMVRQTAALEPHVLQILPQNPGDAGVDQKRMWQRVLAGLRYVIRIVRRTEKMARAEPLSAAVNAGQLKLVVRPGESGAWVKHLLDEFRAAPNGAHDDVIDAAVDVYSELMTPGGGEFAVGGDPNKATGLR